MSVKEISKQVVTLPPGQLLKFSDWFDGYRASLGLMATEERENELSLGQKTELLHRLQMAREHPELMQPWEGTVNQVRERLHEIRRQKAARGRARRG